MALAEVSVFLVAQIASLSLVWFANTLRHGKDLYYVGFHTDAIVTQNNDWDWGIKEMELIIRWRR